MDMSYAPPESEYPAVKRKPWGKWIAWGCGGALGFLVLMAVSCVFMVKGAMKVGESNFGPACSAYLAKIEAKDFSGAYQLIGPDGKESLTEEKHNAVLGGITDQLGPVISKEVQFVSTGVDQKGTWGRMVYKAQFQNGPGTIRLELRKYSNDYKVIGIFYDSPVLAEFLNKAIARP